MTVKEIPRPIWSIIRDISQRKNLEQQANPYRTGWQSLGEMATGIAHEIKSTAEYHHIKS